MTTKELIKQQCKKKGIKVYELAEILKMRSTSLSEKMRRDKMNPKSLQRIADALGCSVYDITPHEEGVTIKCPQCGCEIKLKMEE